MTSLHHVIGVCLLIGALGQINPPIPVKPRTPGSVLGSGTDSAQVQVTIHFYTLPYHKNAGLVTQGFYLIEETLPEQTWNYAQRIFDNLEDFSNYNTMLMTQPEIIALLSMHATQSTGINRNDFEDLLDNYSSKTIRTWKYGSRKGVAGTPWYFVNGVDLGVPPNSANLVTAEKWIEFLNPMLD